MPLPVLALRFTAIPLLCFAITLLRFAFAALSLSCLSLPLLFCATLRSALPLLRHSMLHLCVASPCCTLPLRCCAGTHIVSHCLCLGKLCSTVAMLNWTQPCSALAAPCFAFASHDGAMQCLSSVYSLTIPPYCSIAASVRFRRFRKDNTSSNSSESSATRERTE